MHISTPRAAPPRSPAAPLRARPRPVSSADANGESLAAQQQRAACFSAILARFVSRLDAFQAWLQGSEEGRAISPADAALRVESLERVESALENLQTRVVGGAATRPALGTLLRQETRRVIRWTL